MPRRHFFYLVLLAALALLMPATLEGQRGARTVKRNLDQLSAEATLVVRGRVISARVEPHPELRNLNTVVVSMTVDQTLKGSAGKRLEFRQYIWDIRDRLDSARYAKGQELLLMLGPISEVGLRSPVGLDQGRFVITRDKSGQAKAVNGVSNVGLFDSVASIATARRVKLSARAERLSREHRTGAVPLEDLEDAIRALGGAR